MLNVLDRFFTDKLDLMECHYTAEVLNIAPQIKVHVFHDDPFYLSIFHVNGKPVLKEVMVYDVWSYLRLAKRDKNLHAFLLEYAKDAV